MAMHGALEELLLRYREIINDALYTLQEHAQLDEILHAFQRCVLELQCDEPAFWQLRVVEFIRDAVETHVTARVLQTRSSSAQGDHNSNEYDNTESGGSVHNYPSIDIKADCVSDRLEDRRRTVASVTLACSKTREFAAAVEHIDAAVRGALLQLSIALDAAEATALASTEQQQQQQQQLSPHAKSPHHFLQRFWEQLDANVRVDAADQRTSHSPSASECAPSCSFEAISFDDLDDACGSAHSVPTFEDIPAITARLLQQSDAVDRALALDDLLKIPILEVAHCGVGFRELCAAVVESVLVLDARQTHKRATQFVYELLGCVEDARLVLDVFVVVLTFVAQQYESAGPLCLDTLRVVVDANDAAASAAVDVYRLLRVLLARITQHWLHWPPETLARVQLATLQLLVLSSSIALDSDARRLQPIQALALLDPSAAWFAAWLRTAPTTAQLVAALHDSGFVTELLQFMARVRPLEAVNDAYSVADQIERRTAQHALCIVSQLAELRAGCALLCSWQRVPVHLQLKRRATRWTHVDALVLESRASENDCVYHQQPDSIDSDGNTDDDLDATERLGERMLDAVAMSAVAVRTLRVTHLCFGCHQQPIHSYALQLVLTDESASRTHEPGASSPLQRVLTSLATYLPQLPTLSAIVDAIAQLVEQSLQLSASASTLSHTAVQQRTERDCDHAWFPFRHSNGIASVCALIADCVSVRVRTGALDAQCVQTHSRALAATVVDALSKTERALVPRAVFKTALALAAHVVRALTRDCSGATGRALDASDQRFLKALARLLSSAELHRIAEPFELVHELAQLHAVGLLQQQQLHDSASVCDAVLEVLTAVAAHATGLRDVCDIGLSNACVQWLLAHWRNNDGDTASATMTHSPARCHRYRRQLLRFLVLPSACARVFASDVMQRIVNDATATLLASTECSLALHSAPDEQPYAVRAHAHTLAFLRCCLSAPSAAAAVLALGVTHSRVLAFIVHTLARHDESCMASSDREDLCVIAWQLALALASSIPNALACARLFVDYGLIALATHHEAATQQRRSDDEDDRVDRAISACTLLQRQLQYAFEVAGGASERLQRCELYAFDASTCGWCDFVATDSGHEPQAAPPPPMRNSTAELLRLPQPQVAPFVQTLVDKICSSIESSCDRDAALDFVMLAQASWELIHEIDSARPQLSAAQLACIIGRPLHRLVLSRRSRLHGAPADANASAASTSASTERDSLPADAQRKVMNEFYKRYCHRLALKASPTTLHCLTRTLGRDALACFSVTLLMVLDQVVDETVVLAVVNCCWRSPACASLWPSSSTATSSDDELGALHRVASAAELLLERECPQLLQCIEQCHCSVLTLAVQWFGQCFWNYLDWRNVVLFVYLTALYGVEFQVYMVVAVVWHLEPALKQLSVAHSSESVATYELLLRLPVTDFAFSRYRSLFVRLRNTYHDEVAHMLQPRAAGSTP